MMMMMPESDLVIVECEPVEETMKVLSYWGRGDGGGGVALARGVGAEAWPEGRAVLEQGDGASVCLSQCGATEQPGTCCTERVADQ